MTHHPRRNGKVPAAGHTIVVGAGMAGLAASAALSLSGEAVTLIEARSAPGGKMRALEVDGEPIDSGPTVFTMKYVFDELFALAGERIEDVLTLTRAETLARHAWDTTGHFDLHADRTRTREDIAAFFSRADAAGYDRFCRDAGRIFSTLRDTYIGAPRPSPIALAARVGFHRLPTLLALKPFSTLWGALGDYFPDARLRQLFGRYATYVGSSPFKAPATLMLIAHVEQEGVWFVDGGMKALATALSDFARRCGTTILDGASAERIERNGDTWNVRLDDGTTVEAANVVYCGDISALDGTLMASGAAPARALPAAKRSLSALTWSVRARTSGFPLSHHNVFFSDDYAAEFDAIFEQRRPPERPTVYVCAQDRTHGARPDGDERLFCLVNAPADGDTSRLTDKELVQCETAMLETLEKGGLWVDRTSMHGQITQPADFARLFPGSGGALYGRASHGWSASFQRLGAKTSRKGLYLAGGSVHPGAGVPMATRSGLLAAQQIIADRAST